jgi:hypothetical protein
MLKTVFGDPDVCSVMIDCQKELVGYSDVPFYTLHNFIFFVVYQSFPIFVSVGLTKAKSERSDLSVKILLLS